MQVSRYVPLQLVLVGALSALPARADDLAGVADKILALAGGTSDTPAEFTERLGRAFPKATQKVQSFGSPDDSWSAEGDWAIEGSLEGVGLGAAPIKCSRVGPFSFAALREGGLDTLPWMSRRDLERIKAELSYKFTTEGFVEDYRLPDDTVSALHCGITIFASGHDELQWQDLIGALKPRFAEIATDKDFTMGARHPALWAEQELTASLSYIATMQIVSLPPIEDARAGQREFYFSFISTERPGTM